MTTRLPYEQAQPRDVQALKCPKCGGYCDKVSCTKEELKDPYNHNSSYECCIAAFVCCLCKERIIVKLDAPEME